MDSKIINFLNLIKVSLSTGHASDFPVLSVSEWCDMFVLARKQALIGVLSDAFDKLPVNCRPPKDVLLKWLSAVEYIRRRNVKLNQVVYDVEALCHANGFEGCVLKGQGVAQLYPHPELRMSGDIDIWVYGKRDEIIEFVRNRATTTHSVYHHADGFEVDDVDVEVHFTPSYMANPFANARLQNWINKEAKIQFKNCLSIEKKLIHVPTLAFNRVFILHHIFRHFFYEGIGLRQLMDFYYVLKAGFTPEEQRDTISIYKSLNLYDFAGAVVYVLQKVYGLEERYCIVKPNRRYGEVLLEEVMEGGNFGKATRVGKVGGS